MDICKKIQLVFKAVIFLLNTSLLIALPVQGLEPKFKVLATSGMVADVAKEVGGNHIEIIQLIPSGSDPHSYKITAGDLKRFSDADVVFYNGLHLEANLAEALDKMPKAYALSDGLPKERLIKSGDNSFDPHIWMDVELWSLSLGYVRDILSKKKPELASVFSENSESSLKKYLELHAEVRFLIGRIPFERRVLVTAHDAFAYFGRAYGIVVVGIQGISTQSSVGIKEISRIASMVAEKKLPTIFSETSVSDISIESLINAVKYRGHNVVQGQPLFSDSMGASGTVEGNYPGMMRANGERISAGLTAKVVAD